MNLKKILIYIGLAVSLIISVLYIFKVNRSELLKRSLLGANRIIISDPLSHQKRHKKQNKKIEIVDKKQIMILISMLNFVDSRSGFHCMCSGDSIVNFFKDEKLLVSLSHHHGRSLRWNNGKWKGDSLFTSQASQFWREWFKKQGEMRFENMYQNEQKRLNNKKEVFDKFLSAFPIGAKAVFESCKNKGQIRSSPKRERHRSRNALSPISKKLENLFTKRDDFVIALSKSLGILSLTGDHTGSWSTSTYREKLVLECLGNITAAEFLHIIKSDDDSVLLGASRLFFFENFWGLVPINEIGKYAAKLSEVVLKNDRSGNSGKLFRELRKFIYPEVTSLFENIALSKINVNQTKKNYIDELSPSVAACILLAYTQSPMFSQCFEKNKSKANLSSLDKSGLLVASAIRDESEVLDKSIFDIKSYVLCFGALYALENKQDIKSLDAVIMGGTNHHWAAIRKESILIAQRMIGRKWGSKNSRRQVGSNGKKIRKWWSENRDVFKFGNH